MKLACILFVLLLITPAVFSASREELLVALKEQAGAIHGHVDMETGKSKLGWLDPEAMPLCLELALNPNPKDSSLTIGIRNRYYGILSHYIAFFPDRVSPEDRTKYIESMLVSFERDFLNNGEAIDRGTSAVAFAHLTYFYDNRILEVGKRWLNQHPEFGERQQVYYYEKKFRDMEKIGYSPEKWGEIVKRDEPPLGPIAAQENTEATKQRTWWLALLVLILLVPFTVWIKRRSRTPNP